MEFRFECRCGEQIADFTRSTASAVSTQTGCDGCGSTYDLTITQIANERPSFAVVRAIAAFTNTPVEQVDPLADTVDPEALDTVLSEGEEARVSFAHCGVQVELTGTRVVLAEPAAGH